ncbi:unnamed protein product, partial [marine sediment metagenome]
IYPRQENRGKSFNFRQEICHSISSTLVQFSISGGRSWRSV